MKTVGVIGLGDMGLGMARNLAAQGFPVIGLDLREDRMAQLESSGGTRAPNPRELAARCDTVFLMVLDGPQVEAVVCGPDGLLAGIRLGCTVVLSATILPTEARQLETRLAEKGAAMIDTPVAGGRWGADAGELLLMLAAKNEVLERERPILDAIAKKIIHVGEEIGQGQTVKAALQALVGATFGGMFEALVMGHKAGVSGEMLYEVLGSSGVSSPLFKTCAKLILDRQFEDTGSQITTMYKDLGITMAVAKEAGVPMFTTSAAQQLFQTGMSRYPNEDNWAIVKWLEEIADTKVSW